MVNTSGHLSGPRFSLELTGFPEEMIEFQQDEQKFENRKLGARQSGQWKPKKCSGLLSESKMVNTSDHLSGPRFSLDPRIEIDGISSGNDRIPPG